MPATVLFARPGFVGNLLSTTALAVACLFSGGRPPVALPTLLLKSMRTGLSSDNAEAGLLMTLMFISFRPDFICSRGIVVVVV